MLRSVYGPEARNSAITSAEAFEAQFEGATNLVCIRDLRGKLIRLNPRWTDALGFPLKDLHGASVLNLVHPEDVWSTHDIMSGVSADQMIIGFRNRYRTSDGSFRRFEWTARRFGEYVFGSGQDLGPS